MLQTIETREVRTSGIGEQATFKINANGKAFKVLIDGLYSDKILAVIRELWTNAYDSHIAAGCAGRAFTCHMPSQWKPEFSVRDYGVSLSHEDVMNLYVTVFASSKDNTNTQVGKLGLGSKSPFAYVDAFTVTAWLGGEKRVYSAFIGADYVPNIALMVREPSDEETGLEVAFPAKADDIDAFETAAQKVARGFDVLPGIIGNDVRLQPLKTLLDDLPLWRLVNGDDLPQSCAYAKQGCVVYPINGDAIPGATRLQKAVLRSPFFIEFPIGDLEITASREALGYNESTCRNILAVVDVIAADIQRRYQEEIDAAETFWGALDIYGRFNEVGLDDGVTELLKTAMVWRGRKLGQTFNLQDVLERGGKLGVLGGGVAATYADQRDMNRRGRNLKWEPSTRIWNLTYGGFQVVLEDTTKKTSMPGMRLKHWYKHVWLEGGGVLWLKGDPTSMAVRRVLARLGKPKVTLLETMDRPPHAIKTYQKSAVPLKVLERYKFQPTTVNVADPLVYVRLERAEVECGFSATTVAQVRQKLIELGYLYEDTRIIGVPGTHRKLPGKNPHWQSLWDVARRAVSDGLDLQAAARSVAYNTALNASGCYTRTLEFFLQMVDNDEEFERHGAGYRALTYTRVMKTLAAKAGNYTAVLKLADLIRETVILPEITVPSFDRYETAFAAAYPLTEPVFTNGDIKDAHRKALIDYVNLIDERHGKALSSSNLQVAA